MRRPVGGRANSPDTLNDAALHAEERPEYVAAWMTRASGRLTILEGLGLEVVSSDARPLDEVIEVEVVADAGGLGQAAVDEELRPGVVTVVAALEPAE